jgi:hypothetical protein
MIIDPLKENKYEQNIYSGFLKNQKNIAKNGELPLVIYGYYSFMGNYVSNLDKLQ